MNFNNLGKTPSHNNSTLAISPAVRRVHPGMTSAQKSHPSNSNSIMLNYARSSNNLKTPSKNGFYNTKLKTFANTSNKKAPRDRGNYNNTGTIHIDQQNETKLSTAERLRLWRHDALMQHQYMTAEFVGDKVYSITKDSNDAFWLAQVYYNQGLYMKAIDLLQKNNLDTENIICQYLCGLCLFDLEKYDDALSLIGETNPFDEHLNDDTDRLPKNHSADEIFEDGRSRSRTTRTESQEEASEEEEDGGIKLESSLCLLRGKIYLALNDLESAIYCFKEACIVDVKNFESYQILVENHCLAPDSQLEFFKSLPFETQLFSKQEVDLVKSFYFLKMSNYLSNKEKSILEQGDEIKYLKTEYGLENNTDVLANEIDNLSVQCNFEKCLKLCEFFIQNVDRYNFQVVTHYVSCLYELGGKTKLFQLSHDLVENFPKHAVSWFAAATYHLATNKIGEARKYFSKSAVINPNLLCSWLGFGHTYVAEGEHEQAILVYSTSARLFPGSHLPNLFLGMQYILLNSLSLAENYFKLAYDICSYDPLLLNEMGVVYYQQKNYPKAKKYFKKAHETVVQLNFVTKPWIGIHVNLGHTYRKLRDYQSALECFNLILEISKKDGNVYTSIALSLMKLGKMERAIDMLHKALDIQPSNDLAQELLEKALEINLEDSLGLDQLLDIPVIDKAASLEPIQSSHEVGSTYSDASDEMELD